ncbi:ubiquilin-1 [Drosophila obscura]|uniref:ubiquilin-1 n=1 Tax=Drosophila obscura TaxID=7282 RepID=UPI001BB14652|nr:ubiquilin-1 [Drosophila obscura]
MSRGDAINILAKGSFFEVVVSVRERELVRNLRALVAVRFEQAIHNIVLVFGGQVLRDAGTIDAIGITSGVVVHVVCRRDIAPSAPTTVAACPKLTSRDRMIRSKPVNCLEYMMNSVQLKFLVKSDARMKGIVKKNGAKRHYIKSTHKWCAVISQAPSPAQLEYDRNRRDMLIKRMELVPGGSHLLGRIDSNLRRSYENTVASTYQQFSHGPVNGANSQRGLENRQPLPNPWKSSCNALNLGGAEAMSIFLSAMYTSLQQRYREQLQQLIEMGFDNHIYNMNALVLSSGSLENAIKLLQFWDRLEQQ